MGIARGPNIIKDGLVFGYDTGYGVADNNTSTRFYPGEPTVNSLASTAFGSAGITLGSDAGGTYLQTNSDSTGYNYIKVPNITVSSNETYTWSFELKSLETITQSGNKYYFDTNEHSNEFSTSNDNSRVSSSQVRPSSLPANEWVKFALTVTMKPNLTGAYSYDFLNFIKPHFTSKKIYYRNMQFEHNKSHHTPFVAGTRSSTQSLIDLKRNKTLDISNLSFDGDGQPEFDGTNDVIPIDSITLGNGAFTIDAVIDADAHGYNLLSNSSGGPVTNGFGTNNNRIFYRHYNGSWVSRQGTSTTVSLNTKTHLTWVNRTGGTMDMYVNGVKDSVSGFSSTTTNGGPVNAIGKNWFSYWNGHIYTLKYYNEAFTDAEVLRQFNTYKNRFNL